MHTKIIRLTGAEGTRSVLFLQDEKDKTFGEEEAAEDATEICDWLMNFVPSLTFDFIWKWMSKEMETPEPDEMEEIDDQYV